MEDIPLEPNSMTWGLNDISSFDTGRTAEANCTMQKNRLAQKRKLSLTWNNPPIEAVSKILKMTNPGRYITKQFYSGDKSAPYRQIYANGTVFSTLSFDLIER